MFDTQKPPKEETTHSTLFTELSGAMGEERLSVLRALLSWAEAWDVLHSDAPERISGGEAGKKTLIDSGLVALLAPFGGFGMPSAWAQDADAITALIMNEVVLWHAVPEHRYSTTMRWAVLRVSAPRLAMGHGGLSAASDAAQSIYKYKEAESGPKAA